MTAPIEPVEYAADESTDALGASQEVPPAYTEVAERATFQNEDRQHAVSL